MIDILQVSQLHVSSIVHLEKESHIQSPIMHSILAGQMSFMIRAGINCLLLPINIEFMQILPVHSATIIMTIHECS